MHVLGVALRVRGSDTGDPWGRAVILANSAGAISDPSLSGITIEMESCVGGAAGVQHCADTLEGQRAATLAAGRTPLSVLWLTHSEAMSAAQQCDDVGGLQAAYPWVQAGTDFSDGSHVVCPGAAVTIVETPHLYSQSFHGSRICILKFTKTTIAVHAAAASA